MLLIDEHAILLALQSLTRTLLLKNNPATAIPLAGVSVREFAGATWLALGVTKQIEQTLLTKLRTMFPNNCELPTPGNITTVNLETPGSVARHIFAGWQRGSKHIVYESSGSSGTPKQLVHSHEAVEQEVNFLAKLFPNIKCVVGVTPQHHCYGFIFGVLLHKRLGADYIVHPPLPTIIRHTLAENMLVVGYPNLWATLHTEGFTPPDGLVCLSAGSAWPDASMNAMLDNGYKNLLEIYGSSENGAVGYRRRPGDFTLLDYWQRENSVDGPGVLLRILPSGERVQYPAQDMLNWSSERIFRPMQRLDKAIQVSGMNVYPARIAAIISEHPQVKECRVRLMHPEEGSRLKAFIVPSTDADTGRLRKEIKALCKERFLSPERPVAFRFGSEIPRTDFGKETDWKIT